MLFRPRFCANCGEKVERADWGPFTSRRFCQVCESEFKGQDLIPRVAVIGGLLIGVLGVGAYLKSSPPQQALPLRQPLRTSTAFPEQTQATAAANVQVQKPSDVNAAAATRQQLISGRPTLETSEPMYYCGAETKKGTPCSRRVKGSGRCYQHKGMPAIAPPDKLRIG